MFMIPEQLGPFSYFNAHVFTVAFGQIRRCQLSICDAYPSRRDVFAEDSMLPVIPWFTVND